MWWGHIRKLYKTPGQPRSWGTSSQFPSSFPIKWLGVLCQPDAWPGGWSGNHIIYRYAYRQVCLFEPIKGNPYQEGDVKKTLRFLAIILITFIALPNLSFADFAGCKCYCGKFLRPPCGDEDCKRACGWQEPSTPSSAPAYDYEAERQRQEAERQRQLEAERQRQREIE